MRWLTSLVSVVVFVLCSPNILARLPRKGNKYLVALVHGIIFTIILILLNKYLPVIEGASSKNAKPPTPWWVWLVFALCMTPIIILAILMFSNMDN